MSKLEELQDEIIDLFDFTSEDRSVYVYTVPIEGSDKRAAVVERGEGSDPKTVRIFLKDPKEYTYALKNSPEARRTYVNLDNLIEKISGYYKYDDRKVNCILTDVNEDGILVDKLVIWTNKHN